MGQVGSKAFSTERCAEEAVVGVVSQRTGKEKTGEIMERFKSCVSDAHNDRALGCLFGSFIGDSLGSYCEFAKNINSKTLDSAMKMPGGGVFSLKAGQVTDDSQLSFALMRGLSTLEPKEPIENQHFKVMARISSEYVSWMDSNPFDIGNTCRNGIRQLKINQQKMKGKEECELQGVFDGIYRDIFEQNKKSQSNGSLMRITPMAVLMSCGKLKPEKYEKFIKDEIRLMHANETIQQAGYVWVHLLQKVIDRKGNEAAEFRQIFRECQELDAENKLAEWITEAKESSRMPATTNIGWAKIAWSYGLHEVWKLSQKKVDLNQAYYKGIIKEVIGAAGDTDTNAAIVGGLLGALIGFKNLPGEYLQKMLALKFPEEGEAFHKAEMRPHSYEPFTAFQQSLEFIQKCGNI